MNIHRPTVRARGFTIFELLAVITVLSVLLALLLPSLRDAKESAHKAVCASNLRQIWMGWHSYARDFKGYFPPTWPGGFFTPLYDFNQAYFEDVDAVDVNGNVFFCPTHNPFNDVGGDPYTWTNLRNVVAYDTSYDVVLTSYNLWTHVVNSPNDPDPDFGWSFATNSWHDTFIVNGWATPWMYRTNRAYLGGGNTGVANPSESRIAWDDVYLWNGEPNGVQHYRRGPTGANAVYGDGRVIWTDFEQMQPMPQSGGWVHHW